GGIRQSGPMVPAVTERRNNLNKHWSLVSWFNYRKPSCESQLLWQEAIGVVRRDGSDALLLLPHHSLQIPLNYWSLPLGKPSPDGKVVIFNSNMNGSGRYDLFIAEMPLR